jgi:hypothetical protein
MNYVGNQGANIGLPRRMQLSSGGWERRRMASV